MYAGNLITFSYYNYVTTGLHFYKSNLFYEIIEYISV